MKKLSKLAESLLGRMNAPEAEEHHDVVPKMYNEGADIEKLNDLLDQMMARPFVSSFIAVQSVRAALDLFGITLPKLPIEQDAEKASSIGALTMLHQGKLLSPSETECEYAFKIIRDSAIDRDIDEDIQYYLYFVVDLNDETHHYEAYAQVVDEEMLDRLLALDVPDMDHDYPEQIGDDSGETEWDQRIRHTGTNTGGGSGGFSGEHG